MLSTLKYSPTSKSSHTSNFRTTRITIRMGLARATNNNFSMVRWHSSGRSTPDAMEKLLFVVGFFKTSLVNFCSISLFFLQVFYLYSSTMRKNYEKNLPREVCLHNILNYWYDPKRMNCCASTKLYFILLCLIFITIKKVR